MTMESKRDLHVDLAICDAATAGPWEWKEGEWRELGRITSPSWVVCSFGNEETYYPSAGAEPNDEDIAFIAESRQGWPEAIRRAIAAEAENERLREALRSIMHVSAWDGIAYELDRCYVIAKEALGRR